MKKIYFVVFIFTAIVSLVYANSFTKLEAEFSNNSFQRVSFKIKGTGSKNIPVTIGVGSQPGSGACCSGVSPFTTANFVGNVGDVVYDGKTRRIITKVYREMNGITIDLAQYY